MNEFELIERIFLQRQNEQAALNDAISGIEKGIGDDAAVVSLPIGSRLVSCIDTLVQGRHFDADWDEIDRLAFAIGYKAVAVNVSDIAAMGATPHSLLLALIRGLFEAVDVLSTSDSAVLSLASSTAVD